MLPLRYALQIVSKSLLSPCHGPIDIHVAKLLHLSGFQSPDIAVRDCAVPEGVTEMNRVPLSAYAKDVLKQLSENGGHVTFV